MTNDQREAIKELLTFLADRKPESFTDNSMGAAETVKAALKDAKYFDKFPQAMKAPLTRVMDENDHTGATFLIMGAWVARLEESLGLKDLRIDKLENRIDNIVELEGRVIELSNRLDNQNNINDSLNHRVSNLESRV